LARYDNQAKTEGVEAVFRSCKTVVNRSFGDSFGSGKRRRMLASHPNSAFSYWLLAISSV
jgi:hypothetical protein